MAKIYYKAGRYEVTDRIVRLPRASHDIQKLQSVSVRHTPTWLAGLPALGVVGFTWSLWRYLTFDEVVVLLGASLCVFAGSLLVGTLHVESIALRDGETGMSYGPIYRLRKVRRAIEQAMIERA